MNRVIKLFFLISGMIILSSCSSSPDNAFFNRPLIPYNNKLDFNSMDYKDALTHCEFSVGKFLSFLGNDAKIKWHKNEDIWVAEVSAKDDKTNKNITFNFYFKPMVTSMRQVQVNTAALTKVEMDDESKSAANSNPIGQFLGANLTVFYYDGFFKKFRDEFDLSKFYQEGFPAIDAVKDKGLDLNLPSENKLFLKQKLNISEDQLNNKLSNLNYIRFSNRSMQKLSDKYKNFLTKNTFHIVAYEKLNQMEEFFSPLIVDYAGDPEIIYVKYQIKNNRLSPDTYASNIRGPYETVTGDTYFNNMLNVALLGGLAN